MKAVLALSVITVVALQTAVLRAEPVTNSPPALTCPTPASVECGTVTTLTARVSDPEGGALSVVWAVNGASVQTNSLAASGTNLPVDVAFSAALPVGTNVVEVTATDDAGNSQSCFTTVTVVDTTPPVITSVSTTPKVLWPPNHKLITVHVRAEVTDTCDPHPTWRILSVTSSEAVNAHGTGHTSPDWLITDAHTVKLRAERSGKSKAGRVYTITVQASDASGNLSTPATVTVTVPHDMRGGKGH
jgi:hypothetical protein